MQALTETEAQAGEVELLKSATPVEKSDDGTEAVALYEAAEVMRVSVSVADLRQSLLKERQRVHAAKEASIAASIQQASFAASSLQVPIMVAL